MQLSCFLLWRGSYTLQVHQRFPAGNGKCGPSVSSSCRHPSALFTMRPLTSLSKQSIITKEYLFVYHLRSLGWNTVQLKLSQWILWDVKSISTMGPHMLTTENQVTRMRISLELQACLVAQPSNEHYPDDFHRRIVTLHQTWPPVTFICFQIWKIATWTMVWGHQHLLACCGAVARGPGLSLPQECYIWTRISLGQARFTQGWLYVEKWY